MAKAKDKEYLINLKVRTTGGGRASDTWKEGWGRITWQNGGSLPQTVRRQALKELKKKLAA